MLKLQILLYSFIVPSEFSFNVSGLEITPYRLLLMALFPYIIFGLFTNKNTRWHLCDLLALGVCVWPMIALLANTGIGQSIESGGILFLETFVPYFLARLSITNYDRLKAISMTVFHIIIILVCLGLLDIITGRHITHEIAQAITGNVHRITGDQRFGIIRAIGPVDHSIIYGSICATGIAIAIAFYRRRAKYFPMVIISILGVITSLSSAPLLTMVAQIGLLTWSKLFSGNRKKWIFLSLAIIFVYIVIDILSNRDPFKVMFSYLLFNEHNGYVRYNMWANSLYLSTLTFFNGIFGYGFSTDMFDLLANSFWSNLMKRTVDSYWMVILLRYGWVMLLLNVAFIFTVFKRNLDLGRRTKSKRQRILNEAWLVAVISFSLLACTVHFWGATISFYMFILGAAMIKPDTQKRSTATKTKEEIRMELLKASKVN